MAIYVDPLHEFAKVLGYKGQHASQAARVGARHGHLWCHLFSDSADCEELHAFARLLGMKREWFQRDHYDSCLSGSFPIKGLANE